VSSTVIARSLAFVTRSWSDAPPRITSAQLTALRHLQSDLGPFLTTIETLPAQTHDPVLAEAAERAQEALSELLAEIAIVIYRAGRRTGA
jgi:hypothetical protein